MTDQIDTSSSSALVAAAGKPTSNGNGRIVWPGGPAKKQYFSFPDNIIYYMATNPSSPEGYLKLAKSGKYFFEMKPLLIVATMDGDAFCSNKDWNDCKKSNQECCVDVDLAKLTSKIWLTHGYYINSTADTNPLLPQKLYNCESAFISASFYQIPFDNFTLVTSSFEKFLFSSVTLTEKDGSIVMLEEVLASLPYVKEFDYWFKLYAFDCTTSTIKNICKLDNLGDLRILRLYSIPELFEVKDFEDIIKKHQNTKFWLHFRYSISAGYKAQLDALCDAVMKSESCKCLIEYRGQDEKKLTVMRERYAK